MFKVLHLPYNIASQISVTVQALREIGIDTRGIVETNSTIQDPTMVEMLPKVKHPLRQPIRSTLQFIKKCYAVANAIQWADVIHWHFSYTLPKAYDVLYAARLGKAGIVEFWGSDIRVPRIASADNPYLAQMYQDHPEFDTGAEERSHKLQRTFAEHGMACLIPGQGLVAHVDPSQFPFFYRTHQRLLLNQYQPAYPDPFNTRPMVLHMPSQKAKKGTNAVMRAIKELQPIYDFDFQLVHSVKRSKALQFVRSCDIFLDQFVIGGHGLAALEAMAFGKPTVCYIQSSLVCEYPSELPIVIADQNNLCEVLRRLLENGARRHEIGRLSRAYVEKYHDSRKIAKQLVNIYQELLNKACQNKLRQ